MSTTENEPEFYSSIELSHFLGVSLKSVNRWIAQRRIPGMVKIGRHWKFRRTVIEQRLTCGELLYSEK
jgi:excisionase family DNA binding protein